MTIVQAIVPPVMAHDEHRDFERLKASLTGTLFLEHEDISRPCAILDMSPGGALLACDHVPALDSCAVLYVEGFGRFSSYVVRAEAGQVGLFFVCRDEKRLQTLDRLAHFVESGELSATRLRRHERSPANAMGYFTRADGYLVQCCILDISLHGMSVKTLCRPPVGEIVNLGGTYGRVTRHHKDGIAIQYLKLAGKTEAHP